MGYTSVFVRREIKYIITREQKSLLLKTLEPYMHPDKYGRTTIRNLYFDTPSFWLIRRSIEKPPYKEKLRIRSYSTVYEDTPVFVELKKKYSGIVYKRRLALPERDAMAWTLGKSPCPISTQISREIDYFLGYYGELSPKVYLSYERDAYHSNSNDGFRVTFDENVLARCDRLSLREEVGGFSILPPELVLMELKCSEGIPLWLTRVLTSERIFKTSFSKYGTAYTEHILKNTELQKIFV